VRLAIAVASLLFLQSAASFAQQVKWTSFEELSSKMRTEPRPMLIFIHTDWCKFCALQENKTFTDSAVVKILNENYYALKLNAEGKKAITFLGKSYRYKPSGAGAGEHELAVMLGKENGELSFPTTVLLSDRWQMLSRKSGFINPQNLRNQLNVLVD
jgi:thioredoxin-related protein